MKRDMDLARSILFAIEASEDDPRGWVEDLGSFEGHSDTVVSYHVKLLYEAGFIEADDLSTAGEGNFRWLAKQLTWEGHEFIDTARKDSLWERAKRLTLDKTGGLSLELLKAVLISLGKQAVVGGG